MPKSLFGSIQYLGPDRYRVWWTDEGKRRSKVVHGSRDDAELFLATKRLGQGGAVPDQPWRSYYKTRVEPTFPKLEPKTVSGYTRVWNVELERRIGDVMVGSTTWQFAQDVLLDIKATSVQRAAMRFWKKMCNMAVDDEILLQCPINRRTKLAPHKKREKHMLDVSDVPEFMERIKETRYWRVILLMLGGGMSVEEATAALREEIEPWVYRGRLYAIVPVNKALVTVDGHARLKTSAKNEFREGEVVIGEPFATPILSDLSGEGPICPSRIKYKTDGQWTVANYANPIAISKNWNRWCARNEVDYIRLGDMRSIWSTWQGEAGSSDDVVQLAMGHAGTSTRGRNYLMATRRSLALLADNLQELIEITSAEKVEARKMLENAHLAKGKDQLESLFRAAS